MPHRYVMFASLLPGVAALFCSPLLNARQGETITRETRLFVPVTDTAGGRQPVTVAVGRAAI